MTGPRGEECGRCYYQSECDGKEWLYCHAKKERIDSLVAPDWWCSEFRPHPDHACEKCGLTMPCPDCHGTGLRPVGEEG